MPKTITGKCSCEGTQEGNEVYFALGNGADVVSYRITITFVHCENVVYPLGNPACFVVGPATSMTTPVLMKQDDVSQAWSWKFKWSSQSAYVEAAEPPDAFVDEEFSGRACIADADPEYAWAFTPPTDFGWYRSAALGDPSEVLLFDTIEADDIRQGTLGDCWLMAAISAIANYPERIEDLFRDSEVTPHGRYTITLYDIKDHEWKDVVVDDKIPCFIEDGHPQPVFCRPNGEEIWPMLLEKAVAKFCGSYGALACGNSAWAFQVLTGQEKILRYEMMDDGLFLKKQMNTAKQLELNGARNPRITWWGWQNADKFDVEAMWDTVKRHMASDHVAACMINKGDCPTKQPNGLMSRHLYSFLDAREATLTDGVTRVRLVRLRNPYAECAFSGHWGPHCQKWTEHATVAAQIEKDENGHGDFWLTWEEWARSYTFVSVCPKDLDPHHGPDDLFEGGGAGEVCN